MDAPYAISYSTIVGYETPDTKVAPIITDGTHLRSLHWTGHYIPDPTLAFMNGTNFANYLALTVD